MYDLAEFEEAVKREMEPRGFQKISVDERGTLWGDGDSKSNLAMRVERELGGEDILFVGGKLRPDELYLFEDVIWRWGEEWDEAKLKAELESLVEQTIQYFDFVDNLDDLDNPDNPKGDPPKPALPLPRSLDLVQAHRYKLEEKFSPESIDGTLKELKELSDVKSRIFVSMLSDVSAKADEAAKAA